MPKKTPADFVSREAYKKTPQSNQFSSRLTQKQAAFVKDILAGFSSTQAARRAGYKFPKGSAPYLLKTPIIAKKLEEEFAKHEKKADMTREKVMAGLMEAVDMAKAAGDATAAVSAWREVAKMCGYYAEEKKKIDISINGMVHVNKIENMSDSELLRIIEGEAQIVDDEDLIPLPSFPQPEIPDQYDAELDA